MNGSVSKNTFRILQVSTHHLAGGAARVALNLHRSYLARGIDARLAVATKLQQEEPTIFELPNDLYRSVYAKPLLKQAVKMEKSKKRGFWRLGQFLRTIAEPKRSYERWSGTEDFNFPATRRLMELSDDPDLIHCHNLHGDYFDLRALPDISRKIPTVLTLHDAWLLSGHCAQHQDCERWKSGCGECPDLNLYPKIRRDRTHENWLRKSDIFGRSKLYVITPCKWLMDQVQQSILSKAILDYRIIPNGIDVSVFYPDRAKARADAGLSKDRFTVLISGSTFRENPLSDLTYIQKTLSLVPTRDECLCLILGSNIETLTAGKWTIRSVPYETNLKVVADYYRSADVLLHISKSDTFPNSILESLGSGTPVIASGVGGIPEQVRNFSEIASSDHSGNKTTGILIDQNDPSLFAKALEFMMNRSELRLQMGENARADVCQRFSLQQQVDEYLKFYGEIFARTNKNEWAARTAARNS